MSGLQYNRKIWRFESRKEALEFLIENTQRDFYTNSLTLRNYEIEDRALRDGFVICIDEPCPYNGFITGIKNLEELKEFLNNNHFPDKDYIWLFEVFSDIVKNTKVPFSKILPYRIAYLDKLRESNQPFAYKVYYIIKKEALKDIEIENLLVDTIIELESLNNQYIQELTKYKKIFGDLKSGD